MLYWGSINGGEFVEQLIKKDSDRFIQVKSKLELTRMWEVPWAERFEVRKDNIYKSEIWGSRWGHTWPDRWMSLRCLCILGLLRYGTRMAQSAPCADQCHESNTPCVVVPSSFDTVPVPEGLHSSESRLQHSSFVSQRPSCFHSVGYTKLRGVS